MDRQYFMYIAWAFFCFSSDWSSSPLASWSLSFLFVWFPVSVLVSGVFLGETVFSGALLGHLVLLGSFILIRGFQPGPPLLLLGSFGSVHCFLSFDIMCSLCSSSLANLFSLASCKCFWVLLKVVLFVLFSPELVFFSAAFCLAVFPCLPFSFIGALVGSGFLVASSVVHVVDPSFPELEAGSFGDPLGLLFTESRAFGVDNLSTVFARFRANFSTVPRDSVLWPIFKVGSESDLLNSSRRTLHGVATAPSGPPQQQQHGQSGSPAVQLEVWATWGCVRFAWPKLKRYIYIYLTTISIKRIENL